ncbi:MAG: MerR family transcriptional regulator [Pseudomonadota bacterium]
MKFEAKSASEAMHIAGLRSVAMLDYLERSGVFVRTQRRHGGRGIRRRYDFRDLLVLRVIATLLRNGASVASVKEALIQFQSERWQADPASLGHGKEIIRYLVVSGRSIYFATSKDNLYDLTNQCQLAFSFLIDLDALHSEVCAKVTQREFDFLTASGKEA